MKGKKCSMSFVKNSIKGITKGAGSSLKAVSRWGYDVGYMMGKNPGLAKMGKQVSRHPVSGVMTVLGIGLTFFSMLKLLRR